MGLNSAYNYRLGSFHLFFLLVLQLPQGSDGYLKITDLEETGMEGCDKHRQTVYLKNLHLKCSVF